MCGLTQVLLGIPLVVQGNGSSPSTGVQAGDLRIPFVFSILDWTIMADQSGSIALDVWINHPWTAGTPPTVANTICGGNYPSLAAAESGSGGGVLTGWTTSFPADSWIRWNLRSIATITFFTLELKVRRTIPLN